MEINSNFTRRALVALAAMGMGAGATLAAPDWAKGMDSVERCAGVAKKGKNDCGTKKHDCAGMAKKDNIAEEWVYTPPGVCEKIGGKVLESVEPAEDTKTEEKSEE